MVIEHMPPSYKSMQGAPSLTAEIRRENFRDSLKIHKNLETFLLFNLCRLRYVHTKNTYTLYAEGKDIGKSTAMQSPI